MATEQIELLTRKLNSEADAKLRSRIVERLRPLLELVRDMQPLSLELPEGTVTGAPTTVVAEPTDLVRAIGDAAFLARRDQARSAYIDKFLKTVGGMD